EHIARRGGQYPAQQDGRADAVAVQRGADTGGADADEYRAEDPEPERVGPEAPWDVESRPTLVRGWLAPFANPRALGRRQAAADDDRDRYQDRDQEDG